MFDTVRGADYKYRKVLIQSLSRDMCFHKGLISTNMINYNKDIEGEDENKKKNKLKSKYEKLKKQLSHFK